MTGYTSKYMDLLGTAPNSLNIKESDVKTLEKKKTVKAIGLCSGGLDSILAGLVLRKQGIDVTWVTFDTPFFQPDKAIKASEMTGIPLIVRDITEIYLEMLKNPPWDMAKT